MAAENDGQDGTSNQGNQQQGQGNQGNQQAVTFDSWIGGQDDTIKGLIDSHVSGLKSALDSERNERKSLTKQIAELKGKAEKGSELEQQLNSLTAQLDASNAKQTFYESAPADVANMRLAWMAAQEGGYIGKGGAVDWNGMKTAYPELFRKQITPPANAGNGRGQDGNNQPNMNAFIRRAAGRGG